MAANLYHTGRGNRLETIYHATPIVGAFDCRALATDLASCGIELTPKQVRRALTALCRVGLVERVAQGYERTPTPTGPLAEVGAYVVSSIIDAARHPQA